MSIKNVMLVDDDKAVNFLNQFILTDNQVDAKISVALHGKQALDMIAASPDCPDVILLDINMPLMNGFEFLDRFKENQCAGRAKVYMLTSSLQEHDREKAMQYPCVVDYIEKPLSDAMVHKIFFAD